MDRTLPRRFHEIPSEMIFEIVSHLPDDRDLANLISSCNRFVQDVAPDTSPIWRERFLALYDYPFIASPLEFTAAYKIRHFVFENFVPFSDPEDERLMCQLEVLRDMVLESYNPNQNYPAPVLNSCNLEVMASPSQSPWMQTFLSCFFFPAAKQKYGQAHPFFDTLQLTCSHLLLSPASQFSSAIRTSRSNYDLAVVYNWNRPLQLLYHQLDAQSRMSNTKSSTHKLETYEILHIRNFWSRQLTESTGKPRILDPGENTYAKMAKGLKRLGIVPGPWEKPLSDEYLDIPTEFYGHYSTLGQWPKQISKLEEIQSTAEEWTDVDALTLDFDVSSTNRKGHWPPIFQDIAILQPTFPDPKTTPYRFIRGIAPFLDLSTKIYSSDVVPSATLPKYHPFLAMRLRGVIHQIPAQPESNSDSQNPGVPGWNRIVMVLYKLSTRCLIQMLEHAEGDFGNPFGTAITSQVIQAGIAPGQTVDQFLSQAGDTLDASELEALLERHLREKLLSNRQWRDGTFFTKRRLELMEEKYRSSEFLDWEDIDFAYAYEGAVFPGGKMMMGRWWRLSMIGEGDGMEWTDALGEDDMDLDEEDRGSRDRHVRRERGPFFFWA